MNAWRQTCERVVKSPRNSVAAIGVVIVAVTGTFVVAEGSASATPTVIYACVNQTTKALTQGSGAAPCPSGGTKIHWNQAGPQGPAGATGPQGPAGLSVGYFGSTTSAVLLSGSDSSNQYFVVSTHAVTQTGTYFINATAELSDYDVGAYCDVGTDNGGPADHLTGGGNGGTLAQAAIADSIRVVAGDAPTLWCYEGTSGNTYVANASLTAILMNSVNP